MLASATVQINVNVTSNCSLSIFGPGAIPWIKKAPSKMAIDADPGTPKANVGTSAPPSFALFALSEAITPRTSPFPNVSLAPGTDLAA